jgi:hypothetical protein
VATTGDPGVPWEDQVAGVVERLEREYGGRVGHEAVRAVVEDEARKLTDDARIVEFVPLLVERAGRDRLRQLSHLG